MQKVSPKHIYVFPRKSIRQEKPSQCCAFTQTNSGSVKPYVSAFNLTADVFVFKLSNVIV